MPLHGRTGDDAADSALLPMSVHLMDCRGMITGVGTISGGEATTVGDCLARNQFKRITARGGDTAPFGDRQEVWERDGALIRLTRDRGQWFYDISRTGAGYWLDVDAVAGAMRYKEEAPTDRVAILASTIDDP